jgi:hypothetical protein
MYYMELLERATVPVTQEERTRRGDTNGAALYSDNSKPVTAITLIYNPDFAFFVISIP